MPHASFLIVAAHHRRRSLAAMASRSDDGADAAAVLEALGYRVARGSSSRGGSAALRDLARMAENIPLLGLTIDGPRGPAWRVQPGVVALARWTGLPVVPIVATGPGLVLPTWDRLRVPWPFARCRAYVGPPISLASGTDLAAGIRAVEDALAALRRDAGMEVER